MNVLVQVSDKSKTYKISAFKDAFLEHRLSSMGVLQGASLRVVRTSFWGDSFYVKIGDNGLYIALRKEEAAQILVRE